MIPIELARRWKRSLLGLVVAVGALCFACDAWVARVSDGLCFAAVEAVPEAPVALVLGCSEFLPDGRRNLYFTRRIAAAAELFHAGKVRHLIVSGDNSTADYDEPTAMKKALARAGVPEHSISCDFAGFRTLDSVVRANAIFGQSRMIIVSQRFHGQRAVFLARRHGFEAFAFDASAVGGTAGAKTRLRETLARVAAVLDVTLFDTQPKFFGPPIDIASATPTRGSN